ncbi:MAG: DUF4337 domain-containing protein [Planctomycetia bacterium]|nr:DUF4337 domain-containing protein [Planctomycetia bacterium]
MTSTHEHLEHGEHAQHAAHDPFDRKVSMTMAIIAAVLAAITMLSHREHTETLRLQSEANSYETKAVDKWNYFQAKNIREHEYEAFQLLLSAVAHAPGKEAEAQKAQDSWAKYIKRYKEEELPQLKKEAEHLDKEAKEYVHLSHLSHQRTSRFDLGELGVELGIVFCSLAVLTKRNGWWYSSMILALVGFLVAMSAFLTLVPGFGAE